MIKNIFICYARDDFHDRGIRLRNYLSNQFPDIDVYIDQTKTKGQNWEEVNYAKLDSAQIVIVILTPAALSSLEVKNEIELAKTKSKIIIPCKDDSLEIEWNDVPFGLGKIDGIEFEIAEILYTRLYAEIKKIVRSQPPDKQIIIEDTARGYDEIITKKITQGITMDAILVKDGKIDLRLDEKNFELKFRIFEGDLQFVNSTIEVDSNSIILNVNSSLDSIFELTVPRNLIDSKFDDIDGDFIVLVDGTEFEFEEKRLDNVRTIKLKTPAGSTQIEIIGSELLSTTGATIENNLTKIISSNIKEVEITIALHENNNQGIDIAKNMIQTKFNNWLSIFKNCKQTEPYQLSGYGLVCTIDFNDEQIVVSCPHFSESNFGGHIWQTVTIRIIAQKPDTIGKLVKLGKYPYWNIRWLFSSPLDVDELIAKIYKTTGKIPTSKGGIKYGSRTVWNSATYPVASEDSSVFIVNIGVNQIDLSIVSNESDKGFYRAHSQIYPDLLIRHLLNEIKYVEIKNKLAASCNKQ